MLACVSVYNQHNEYNLDCMVDMCKIPSPYAAESLVLPYITIKRHGVSTEVHQVTQVSFRYRDSASTALAYSK